MEKKENIHLDPSKLFGLSQALRVEGADSVREHDLHSKIGGGGEVFHPAATQERAKELHTKAGEVIVN